MEMPALIVELQSLKHQREGRIEELKKQLHQQLLDDLARIRAIAATVQKLLVHYKQHDAPRVLHAKVQWLVACSRAMGVRANVLAKQVLVETYTSDRIALLSRVQYVYCRCMSSFVKRLIILACAAARRWRSDGGAPWKSVNR
jgi:hypothetical protein